MKLLPILTSIMIVFIGCAQKKDDAPVFVKEFYDSQKIPLDDYWRKVTGYDSVQVLWDWNGDNVHLNFCYPNQWEFNKFRKDTVIIHDTIYTSKNYGNVETVIIGGN